MCEIESDSDAIAASLAAPDGPFADELAAQTFLVDSTHETAAEVEAGEPVATTGPSHRK